jgi:hypothetical protein
VLPLKHGAALEVVNALIPLTLPYQQLALLGCAELTYFLHTLSIMWIFQPLRMEVFQQLDHAQFIIQWVYDWKVHADKFRIFRLVLNIGQTLLGETTP